jgi:hypothetical protein
MTCLNEVTRCREAASCGETHIGFIDVMSEPLPDAIAAGSGEGSRTRKG